MTSHRLSLAFTLLLSAGLSSLSRGADFVKLDRQTEIEQALSAAPVHLRVKAGVFVREARGYVRVRPSTNGFNCIAHRAGAIVAPTCFDAEGSETNLKGILRGAELEGLGKSAAEVENAVAEEYKSGKLLAPRRNGIAYMLSPHFKHHGKNGEAKVVFAPHIMLYAPNLKNSDIGALPEHVNSPFHPFVLEEGKPWAYIIMVPPGTQLPADPISKPAR